ncbi:MAG: PAS domain-containing protein [Sneathiella sp.]|nr:PAS domain-containing protein [Sneathiella sp.]
MNFASEDASKRADNFRLIRRRRLESISQLSCIHTRTLFEWWQSYGPTPPSREDFDITKLPSLASHIFLIEVLSPGKYLYRLCGQDVGSLIGKIHRMVEFSSESVEFECRKLAAYLDAIIAEDTCCYCTGDLSLFAKKIAQFESIDCPLKNADGTITHFVGVLCEVPK